jgi:hypothetical protein
MLPAPPGPLPSARWPPDNSAQITGTTIGDVLTDRGDSSRVTSLRSVECQLPALVAGRLRDTLGSELSARVPLDVFGPLIDLLDLRVPPRERRSKALEDIGF